MNLNKIRNMSDAQLTRYLNNVSQRNAQICCKCGNVTSKPDRIGIFTYKGCENKKLCTLCYDCYVNLLDYLEIADND